MHIDPAVAYVAGFAGPVKPSTCDDRRTCSIDGRCGGGFPGPCASLSPYSVAVYLDLGPKILTELTRYNSCRRLSRLRGTPAFPFRQLAECRWPRYPVDSGDSRLFALKSVAMSGPIRYLFAGSHLEDVIRHLAITISLAASSNVNRPGDAG